MSLRISSHGGYCCGIRHVSNFSPLPGRVTKEDLERVVAQTQQYAKKGMLVEAVLTNGQLNANPELGKILDETGFKLVSRFQNPNSNNICNVFHYNKAPRSLTARLPRGVVRPSS